MQRPALVGAPVRTWMTSSRSRSPGPYSRYTGISQSLYRQLKDRGLYFCPLLCKKAHYQDLAIRVLLYYSQRSLLNSTLAKQGVVGSCKNGFARSLTIDILQIALRSKVDIHHSTYISSFCPSNIKKYYFDRNGGSLVWHQLYCFRYPNKIPVHVPKLFVYHTCTLTFLRYIITDSVQHWRDSVIRYWTTVQCLAHSLRTWVQVYSTENQLPRILHNGCLTSGPFKHNSILYDCFSPRCLKENGKFKKKKKTYFFNRLKNMIKNLFQPKIERAWESSYVISIFYNEYRSLQH